MLDENAHPLAQDDIYWRLTLLSAQWAREAADKIAELREGWREDREELRQLKKEVSDGQTNRSQTQQAPDERLRPPRPESLPDA